MHETLLRVLEDLAAFVDLAIPLETRRVMNHDTHAIETVVRRQWHNLTVTRINYNSPLELVMLLGGAAGTLSIALMPLVKLGKVVEQWRRMHAGTRSSIEVERLKSDLLGTLAASVETVLPGDIAEIERLARTLKEIASIKVELQE